MSDNVNMLANAELVAWLMNEDNIACTERIINLYSDINTLITYGNMCGITITNKYIKKNFGDNNAKFVTVFLRNEAIKTVGAVMVADAEGLKGLANYENAGKFIKSCMNGELKKELNELRDMADTSVFNLKALMIVGSRYDKMQIDFEKEELEEEEEIIEEEIIEEEIIEEEEKDEEELIKEELIEEEIIEEEEIGDIAESSDKKEEAPAADGVNPKTDRELLKDIEAKFGAEVDKTIKIISDVYTGLFASGYGVIEPEGLMCDGNISGAFLYLSTEVDGVKTGISRAKIEENSYLDDAYKVLKDAMGLKESNSRVIQFEQIMQGYNYFPYKLLEFAFGKCASDASNVEAGTYKRHSNSKMWRSKNENDKSGYLDAVIVTSLKKDLLNVLYAFVKSMENTGKSMNSREGFQLIKDGVQGFMERIIRAYCPCIVVSENSDGRFKIRISDIDAKLSHGRNCRIGMSVREQIKVRLLDAIGGTVEKGVDPVNCVTLRADGSVLEFEVIRNSKLCGAVPLFAYKALDKLKEQGETVSWDNIILGRAEDDSVYTGNNGTTKVNFNGNTTLMHISAGSRSGKGVMTLNIVSSALASGIPLFYLDSKPDMSALIRRLAPNYETFAINGGLYDGKADDMKLFIPNGPIMGAWDKNLPSYLRGANLGGVESWSSAQYFKALDFCIYLMSKIGKGGLQTYGLNPGTDDMLVVVDELWRFLGTFSPLLNKLKSLRPSDAKMSKGTATELEQYAMKFTNWQYEAITSWRGAKNATLAGTKPSMLLIYQEMAKKTSKTKYGADILDDGPAGNSSVYRTLLELGTEALVGYNKSEPHELVKTDKGKKFLTYANRYFAYVPNIENQLDSEAEYFKPFLILNDAIEDVNNDKNYVGQLKNQMRTAGLDVESVLEQHRMENGQLRPEIGFESYIKAMGGSVDVGAALHKSYDIAQMVLEKMGYFRESGNKTVFEYLFDMRPEYLLTWEQMNNALLSGTITGGTGEGNTGGNGANGGNGGFTYTFGTGSNFFGVDKVEEPVNDTVFNEKADVSSEFNNEYAKMNNGSAVVNNEAASADRQREEELFDASNASNDKGMEVSSVDEFDLEKEMNKPICARSVDTATEISKNNPRKFEVYGSKENPAIALNERNSIDCTYCGVSPFMEKIYEKSANGINSYRSKIWKSILKNITNKRDGISKMKVAIVSLKGDSMYVNKKYINLSGIIGGDTGISLSNIVNFRSLIKAFPGIIELSVDDEMLNAAMIEYDSDNPEYEIFETAKTLMMFNLTRGAETINIGNRADILRNKRSEALTAVKNRINVGNEISAMCMIDKEAKIVKNKKAGRTPAGLNQKVWLKKACKSNFGKVKNNFKDSKKIHPVSTVFWGSLGVVCGIGSMLFWGIGKVTGRKGRKARRKAE